LAIVRGGGPVNLVLLGIMQSLVARTDPLIESGPDGGFRVALFVDEPSNFEFPFRTVLGNLVEKLKASGNDARLELPPQVQGEDFVDGRLLFADAAYVAGNV
jgi:hypothetical protein